MIEVGIKMATAAKDPKKVGDKKSSMASAGADIVAPSSKLKIA